MQILVRSHPPAAHPLVNQRVRQEVTTYLLGYLSLSVEDQAERFSLFPAEVRRSGDFEPVADLTLHR